MPVQQATYGTPRADLSDAFYEYTGSGQRWIANLALPILRVGKKSATYPAITRESLASKSVAAHANGASFNRVHLESEDKTYACLDYRLEGQVTAEDEAFYAEDYNVEKAMVRRVTNDIMINREVRVKEAVFNTTTFTGSDLFTDVSSAPWDAAASGAIGHVLAATEKVRLNTGLQPNALILGAATLVNLLGNTGVKAQFPGAPLITRALLEQALPGIFGLDKLIVGGCVYNGAKEGQAFSGTDIWGDDYALVALVGDENDPLDMPSLGRTFSWNKFGDEGAVTMYDEPQTESVVYRIGHYQTEVIVDAYFGHLLQVDA